MPAPSVPSARHAAAHLLNEILGEGRMLSDLTQDRYFTRLEAAERARAMRLATETLRGMERADRILSRHIRKPPPLPVRNLLRLGTVELCHGGEAHGVVNDLVAALDRGRHSKLKGLVNAVLRKVADEDVKRWHDLRIPRLPRWLREPLLAAWGTGAVNGMEKAHWAGAPLDITVKSDATGWAERLGGRPMPTGSVRLDQPGQVSALPGFAEGDWWVQDAAAALPARVLAPQAGEQVLDLCAAPGGKTLQLAAAGVKVTALDISEHRMKRVAENLARTGLQAECMTGDALAHEGAYDAVLLDAPCSATGTIRRHPDLPHARTGEGISEVIGVQTAMLDHALRLLKPGGRLVYATCSLLPDEGECQIEAALARHAGLRMDRQALDLPGIDPAWISEEGGLRLRPDYWAGLGGMDGFYMACLQKG